MKQINIKTLQNKLRNKFSKQNVKMIGPETIFFSKDTKIGKNVIIEPYVVIGQKVKIGNNVTIKSFSHLENCKIENKVDIGPYARIRPGVVLKSGSKIGNFVELKNSEEEYARVVDVNQRIVKASGRLKELQLLRETQVLNTMYLEIVKNLELAKMALLNQTPIISVLDKPVLPLEDEKIPTPIFSILIAFLGTFFSIFFLIFKKFISDVLKD